MKNENQKNIVANSLWDFLCAIQEGVKDGFVLSSDNSCFPQGFVSLYTATLVKPVADATTNEVEITTPVKEVTIADIVTNELIKTAAKKPKVK